MAKKLSESEVIKRIEEKFPGKFDLVNLNLLILQLK